MLGQYRVSLMQRDASRELLVGLVAMALLVACGSGTITSTSTGHDPYAYTKPTPPYEPTPVDGMFARRVTPKVLGPAGGCRRCPPYRLALGDEILGLCSGTFRVYHAGSGYMSVGHYEYEGDMITLFNDPNCPQDRGTFSVVDDGAWRVLDPVDDPCAFDRVRERFLSALPWRRIDLPEGIYEASATMTLVLLGEGFSLWEGEAELTGTVSFASQRLTIDVDGCGQTFEWAFNDRTLQLEVQGVTCGDGWVEALDNSDWNQVG